MKKIKINETLLAGIVVFLVVIGIYLSSKVISAPQNDSCREAVKAQAKAYDEDNLSLTETFDKYKVEVYQGELSSLNTKMSSSGAREFRTMIGNKLSETGINFAGKYSIVSVGLTGWGENYFLVDRSNGKGIVIPFNINFFDVSKESSLLIVNQPKSFINKFYSDHEDDCEYNTGRIAEYYPDLRPYYYYWDGKSFIPLGNPAPKNEFWKAWELN